MSLAYDCMAMSMSSPSMGLSCAMAGLEVTSCSRFVQQTYEAAAMTIATSSPFASSTTTTATTMTMTKQQLADAHARTQKALHRASKKAAMKAAMKRMISQREHMRTPKARRETLKIKGEKKGGVEKGKRKARCYEREKEVEGSDDLEVEMEWGIYSSPMARVEKRLLRTKVSKPRKEVDTSSMQVDGFIGFGGVHTPRR